MNISHRYQWADVPRMLVLAISYALLAKLVLGFFSSNGIVTIIWPLSGLALASMLLTSGRFWIAIFLGAFAGNLMAGTHVLHAFVFAVGSAAEALVAYMLLVRYSYPIFSLSNAKEYMWLAISSMAGAAISALVGTITLYLYGSLSKDFYPATLMHWWQANLLGMILVTPLILVWRHLPKGWLSSGRVLETVSCFGLALLAGQIICAGWFHESLGHYSKVFFIFIFVTWAALRYGRHGVLLIISIVSIQSLYGVAHHSGFFADDNLHTGLETLWFFVLTLTLVGVTLSLILTQREMALNAIHEREQKLSSIVESSMDAIIQMDIDGNISVWSRQAEALFGWTRDDVIGKPMHAYIIPERYRAAHIRGLKHYITTGQGPVLNTRMELSALHRDGHEFQTEMSISPVFLDGKVEFNAYIRDITDRKAAEAKIHRQANTYAALSEINQAIVRMGDHEDLFPLVCRCAVDFGGMEMAWIGQLNEGTHLIHPVASYGNGLEYLNDLIISSDGSLSQGCGPVGIAYRERRTVVVEDFSQSNLTVFWHKKAKDFDWKSAASFPILRAGKAFAVFTVYSKLAEVFDPEIIALFEEMSFDVSFALDNFDREMQRKQGEESSLLAASIYATSNEGMVVTDAENCIIAINPAFTEITGYALDDVMGKNPSLLKSGRHDVAFYQAMWAEINGTGRWQGELWSKRKNGDIFAERLSINTIFHPDGSVYRRVGLMSDVTKRKQSDEIIWRQANFDPLTGLPNRHMFYDRLDQEIKNAHRNIQQFAVLFLDMDRFKEINDTMGHDMGDVLLQDAARRIVSCVRESDTVARLGGDEFTVILSQLDDASNLGRVAHDILSRLSQPFQLGLETAYISASIGITLYPDDALEIDALLKNADQAMYAAKNQGRNRYSYFTPSMQASALSRMRLANDLRTALDGKEFHIVYQPIVEMSSGKIYKAEALLRWQHPHFGLVSPIDFISIAEDTGSIIPIGDWVFTEASKQVALWREQFHSEFQVSINKSPVQFQNEQISHTAWISYLNDLGLPGQAVVVEITEGLLLDAKTLVTDKLIEFRDAGIQVSLDDFGTGYSSLSYLKKFDIDYLKIDQSFVRNLAIGSDDMALCEAIIVMAHKLGIKVVAEGIETALQRDLLTAAGCDYGQGYFYSKPVSVESFEQLLQINLA